MQIQLGRVRVRAHRLLPWVGSHLENVPDFTHLTIPHFLTPLRPSSFLRLRFTIQGFQLSKPHVMRASVGQPSMAPTHKVSPACDWPTKDTWKAPMPCWSPSSAWVTGKVSLPVWSTQLPQNPVPQTQPFTEDEWAILKVSECCLLNRQQTTAPYQDEVWEAPRGLRDTGFPVTFRYWPAPGSACIHSCSHRAGAGGGGQRATSEPHVLSQPTLRNSAEVAEWISLHKELKCSGLEYQLKLWIVFPLLKAITGDKFFLESSFYNWLLVPLVSWHRQKLQRNLAWHPRLWSHRDQGHLPQSGTRKVRNLETKQTVLLHEKTLSPLFPRNLA